MRPKDRVAIVTGGASGIGPFPAGAKASYRTGVNLLVGGPWVVG